MAARRTVAQIRDEIRACENTLKDAQGPILNAWSMSFTETQSAIKVVKENVKSAKKRLYSLKRALKQRDGE